MMRDKKINELESELSKLFTQPEKLEETDRSFVEGNIAINTNFHLL